MSGAFPPSDYPPHDEWGGFCLRLPDTQEWRALVRGVLTRLSYGYYWDKSDPNWELAKDVGMYIAASFDVENRCDDFCGEIAALVDPEASNAGRSILQAIDEQCETSYSYIGFCDAIKECIEENPEDIVGFLNCVAIKLAESCLEIDPIPDLPTFCNLATAEFGSTTDIATVIASLAECGITVSTEGWIEESMLAFRQVGCTLEVDTGAGYTQIYNGNASDCQENSGQPGEQPGVGDWAEDECKTLTLTVRGNEPCLIPFPIEDCWEITNVLVNGLWSINDDAFSNWKCPGGETMALGACVGPGEDADGSFPVPSGRIGELIILGPNDFASSLRMSETITVPEGTGTGNYVLQMNDTDLSNNLGEIVVTIQVCKKSCDEPDLCAGADFNFKTGQHGWRLTTAADYPFDGSNVAGSYVDGSGFKTMNWSADDCAMFLSYDLPTPLDLTGKYLLATGTIRYETLGHGSIAAFGVIDEDVYIGGSTPTLPDGWAGTDPIPFGPVTFYTYVSGDGLVEGLALKIQRVWTKDYNGTMWLEDLHIYCEDIP